MCRYVFIQFFKHIKWINPTEPRHLQARIRGLSSDSSGHQQKRQLTYSSEDLLELLFKKRILFILTENQLLFLLFTLPSAPKQIAPLQLSSFIHI